jgi:hypothetical protein
MTSAIDSAGGKIVPIDYLMECGFAECNAPRVSAEPLSGRTLCSVRKVQRLRTAKYALLHLQFVALQNVESSYAHAPSTQRRRFNYWNDTIQGEIAA